MRKIALFVLLVIAPQIILVYTFIKSSESKSYLVDKLKEKSAMLEKSGVDHSKLKELQKEFNSPQEVTETCLSCHTERGKEIMQTAHWKWERETYIPGKGIVYIGKKNMINNFCTGIAGSEGTCTRCHIGYGYEDKNYDFSQQKNIDCLVCHDNTGLYRKASGKAGYPDMGKNAPEYNKIVQAIGKPKKENCGICHFYSAGGNNVKQGTLDNAMLSCTKDIDVHMAKNGSDMDCIECHETKNHEMKGRYYGVSSRNFNRATCEECHTTYPHSDDILNEHTLKVACQTCHIPTYAKANATKMNWDWSTATKLDKNGKPYSIDDSLGNHTFLSIKGNFVWKRNVEPDYVFFNGTAGHYLLGDTITEIPVKINTLYGDYSDKHAKIWPVKIHKGKQPYDVENNYIVQMKLWDKDKGNGALWKDFDWQKSIYAGMEYINLPYSGKYDFVETEMYLPVSHQVAKASKSLTCIECHTRNNGRLANVAGFYMPGRDKNDLFDSIGIISIILSLLGVLGHASIRIFFDKKNKKKHS